MKKCITHFVWGYMYKTNEWSQQNFIGISKSAWVPLTVAVLGSPWVLGHIHLFIHAALLQRFNLFCTVLWKLHIAFPYFLLNGKFWKTSQSDRPKNLGKNMFFGCLSTSKDIYVMTCLSIQLKCAVFLSFWLWLFKENEEVPKNLKYWFNCNTHFQHI